MQRKLPVIIDDCMSGVRSTLKTDDDIGILGKHIGDLALALIAPICSDNRFYHNISSLCTFTR